MRPIVITRRVEVRSIGLDVLQQRAYLTTNEIFLRTEVDHGGFILSVSLGVGSLDDLKLDRIQWKAYSARQTSDDFPDPESSARPRRVFDFNRSYESLAPRDSSSTTIHRAPPAQPPTFSPRTPTPTPTPQEVARPSRDGDKPRVHTTDAAPTPSAVIPPPSAAPAPVLSPSASPSTQPPAPGELSAPPQPVKSRVSDFPELARVHEYDAGHNIADLKERLAYQVNLKAVRAFARGVKVSAICDEFALTKERLYRVLKSHRDKGRDGLVMLKRNRPSAVDNTRRGFDE